LIKNIPERENLVRVVNSFGLSKKIENTETFIKSLFDVLWENGEFGAVVR
jgi:hypothetical protein